MIKPLNGTKSFRVEKSFNMDNDADDRFVFSRLVIGAPKRSTGRHHSTLTSAKAGNLAYPKT